MILKRNAFLILCVLMILLSLLRCNIIKKNSCRVPDSGICRGYIYKSTWNKQGQYIVKTEQGNVLLTIYGNINNEIDNLASGGADVVINKSITALLDNSYGDYLRSKGIQYTLNASINDVKLGKEKYNIKSLFAKARVYIRSTLLSIMPEKNAFTALAVMTGANSEMDENTSEQYRTAGILHVTAVSGMHVNIMMKPVNILIKRKYLGYKGRTVCRIVTAIIFMILTDFSHSVVRAVLMFIYIQIGKLCDRQATFANSIFFAAIVQLICNPFVIYSVGFVLSYSAVLSICYIVPVIPIHRRNLNGIRSGIGVNIGMMPLLMYYFGEISLITIIINGIAGFLSGGICISGYACCLLMALPVVSYIGKFIGYICVFFTTILNKCAYLASWLPAPIGNMNVKIENVWILIGIYTVIIVVILLQRKRTIVLQTKFN